MTTRHQWCLRTSAGSFNNAVCTTERGKKRSRHSMSRHQRQIPHQFNATTHPGQSRRYRHPNSSVKTFHPAQRGFQAQPSHAALHNAGRVASAATVLARHCDGCAWASDRGDARDNSFALEARRSEGRPAGTIDVLRSRTTPATIPPRSHRPASLFHR
jgi:hypothetical protein